MEDDIITRVIQALAEADSVEPDQLSYSLHDYIDPEVLLQLEAMDDSVWEFTFLISDHYVTITHERQIRIDGTGYTPVRQ